MIVISGAADSYTPNNNAAAAAAGTTHFEVTQKALHCFYAVEHREDAMWGWVIKKWFILYTI